MPEQKLQEMHSHVKTIRLAFQITVSTILAGLITFMTTQHFTTKAERREEREEFTKLRERVVILETRLGDKK